MTQMQQHPSSVSADGALARLTSEHIRAALRLATSGRVYDLGLEIFEGMPSGPGVPFSRAFYATPEGTGGVGRFQFAAEVIISNLHTSTHIDALAHVQADDRIFGGHLARNCRDDHGWQKHGMETVPPIIGRCLILDVATQHGTNALADGYEITVEDVQAAIAASGTLIRSGDIVLVRTGKVAAFYGDSQAYGSRAPGIGTAAAVWLYEQGMAVLGIDAPGTDPLPFRDPAHTTHRSMLVERGVHVIENVYLEDLAADDVREALFICLPLKVTGGTGSWVRPVAMV